MKISTKGIYALEIISDLALHSSEECLGSLKDIAKRRGLSEKYLERIIKALKEKGLVNSTRGAYGGYCLAVSLDRISTKDVLKAVEGELAPVECLTKETDCGINCDFCCTRKTWGTIWNLLLQVTEEVTIADIVSQIHKLEKEVE